MRADARSHKESLTKLSVKKALAIAAVLPIALASVTFSAQAQGKRNGPGQKETLNNDKCEQQVRAKYPSGMSKKARLQMVENCRAGRSW